MTGPIMPPAPGAHLDEAERHGLADDTLVEAPRRAALAHVAVCPSCAADVARLAAVRARVARLAERRTVPNESDPTVDALWPSIRSRIEQGKVVSLSAPAADPLASPRRPGRRTWVMGAVAATLLLLAVPVTRLALRARDARPAVATPRVVPSAASPATSDLAPAALGPVADSATAYRRQVESLLEELELRRALIRPSTATTFDRDLKLIDAAIAELTDALARDPTNPALRQLLAASYRQKRDLLKRIDDAS